MAETFFAIGRILAPWGIHGEVKLEVLTDFPERLAPKAKVYLNGALVEIERCRFQGRQAILKLASITTRNQAEALRDQLLEVPESELMPLLPDEYFEHQIIGLEVQTIDGRSLGNITEVLRTGSNDVYVARQEGKEYLIPAIADVVKEIDLEAGRMTIEPLPGLLE